MHSLWPDMMQGDRCSRDRVEQTARSDCHLIVSIGGFLGGMQTRGTTQVQSGGAQRPNWPSPNWSRFVAPVQHTSAIAIFHEVSQICEHGDLSKVPAALCCPI